MQPTENTSKEKANNNVSKGMKDDIKSIKKDGASLAETVVEQGHDKYDEVKSYLSKYTHRLEERVASKPLQSMAIAVGSGMLLSLLLKRG